jgi:hypothetical protein
MVKHPRSRMDFATVQTTRDFVEYDVQYVTTAML